MELKKSLGLVLLCGGFAINAMAADNAAKEDFTPPAAEGALTTDQIPPISNIGKPMTTPAQPATTTMPTTPTTIPNPLTPPAPAGQMEQVPATGR